MTVILVTHDREEALSMSDRVALMFDGRLIQIGTPREVYAHPASQEAADYFGNCIYIRGKVENGCFCAPGICCVTAAEAGEYTLMLRPDALDLEIRGEYPVTVEAISFRGADSQATLRAADGTLWKKTCTGETSWQQGDIVWGSLNIQDPVLFSDKRIGDCNK